MTRTLARLAALLLLAPAVARAETRLALAIGSNDGGPDRAPLWYAERDAERFAGALLDAAGFRPDEVRVVSAASAAKVRAALEELERRARDARGPPSLVIVYYSGHADPLGLRLGADRLPYAEISATLGRVAGDVRVAIVDACHAGTLTQEKGATPAPVEFEVPRAGRAEGVAILTSTSPGEPAHESAALGASFFTHHLTAGLRGAADADGDDRVTLAEAFRYAYGRTVSSTAMAGVPPQHPSYAMRLSGQGDVVLSDLRTARSALTLAPGPDRRYLLSRAESGDVVAEVVAGMRPVRVALAPGRYRVERIVPEPRRGGEVVVPPGAPALVDDAALRPVSGTLARSKGRQGAPRVYAQLVAASPLLRSAGPALGAGLGVRVSAWHATLLAGASYSERSVDDDGFRYAYRAVTLSGGAAAELPFRRVALLGGVQGGATLVEQRFDPGGTAEGTIWSAGPFAGVAVSLGPAWAVRVEGGASWRWRTVNAETTMHGAVQAGIAIERAL